MYYLNNNNNIGSSLIYINTNYTYFDLQYRYISIIYAEKLVSPGSVGCTIVCICVCVCECVWCVSFHVQCVFIHCIFERFFSYSINLIFFYNIIEV